MYNVSVIFATSVTVEYIPQYSLNEKRASTSNIVNCLLSESGQPIKDDGVVSSRVQNFNAAILVS